MRRFAIIPGIIFLLATMLVGCGGGSSSNNNAVSTVTVSPTSLSLNAGDVAQITASAQNSSNTTVSANFTFSSSNPNLITISNSGLVCGGVWDANFIVCNGKDSSGNPVSGTANVTATASGVTSSPVAVAVHPKVSTVVVDPVAGCTSSTQTQQFTAHACSPITPHDVSGPCAPNASEVTSKVGTFSWGTVDPTVATVDTNGLATAVNPGQTGVFAIVSGVNSSATPFRTCMPVRIRLHVVGDPPGSPTTSATMTQNQTLNLEADMDDENGVTKNSVTTVNVSSAPTVGSISGTTLTASSFGGAGIVAGCTPPTCGNGFVQPFPVYSNLFRVTVPGSTPSTTVYVASSFSPPTGTLSMVFPVDTGTGNVGAAINLPGVPNSMVMSGSGNKIYLGTNSGLVAIDTASSTAALIDPNALGKVLAVSANGTKVILSNAAKDPQGNVIQPVGPSQRVWIFDASNSTTTTFVKPGAVAARIAPDGFRDYIVTNDGTGNIYVFSPSLSLQTINIAGNSTDVTYLPSNSFAYVANSAGLEVIATCNNAQQPTANNPPTNSSTIQLVQPIANTDGFVAVDSTGVDVETATVTQLTPPLIMSPASCVPGVSYSNQFIDFGVGAFTASKLFVATDGSRIAVLPVGNSNVLSAVPGASPTIAAIPLAGGGTQALSGGMTPDGKTLWVGVAGTNNLDKIDLTTNSDVKQIALPNLKKSDGTPAPPDIVVVQPK